LLLGTLASGIVEVFVSRENLLGLLPRRRLLGILIGSLLGLFFPVCECGVVPLTRRLYQKGLPVPVGITFLLAAPVINPIVIASTWAAFGPGLIFWGRIGLTLVIAILTGLIFSLFEPSGALRLLPEPPRLVLEGVKPAQPSLSARLRRMWVVTADEFFEMGRYLVLGGLLAALMQTFVPQGMLLSASQGPVISVLVMVTLAVLLSVCSTVDAFIALAFAASFTSGSVLAFLVYGPMVDIKSTVMYLRVFRRRSVAFLVLLPLAMTVLATVAMNLLGKG
jgi:uncharacterized protein